MVHWDLGGTLGDSPSHQVKIRPRQKTTGFLSTFLHFLIGFYCGVAVCLSQPSLELTSRRPLRMSRGRHFGLVLGAPERRLARLAGLSLEELWQLFERLDLLGALAGDKGWGGLGEGGLVSVGSG